MASKYESDARTGTSSPAERTLGTVRPSGSATPPNDPADKVTVWPDLLYRELLAALVLVVALMVAAIVFDAPLEEPADPTRTPNPAKAPWYFVGLQELLTYFDPWIAGVCIPLLITIGLCAIPYLDPTRTDQGVYTIRRRPLASAVFITGIVGWFVLIAIGLWFRGPGWAWVWPGHALAHAESSAATWSVPNVVGIPAVLGFFGVGGYLIVRWTVGWPGFTRWRRWVFALLLLAMTATLIKIVLRVVFGIQYVVSFDRFGFNI